MTIEQSIRQAMDRLGILPDGTAKDPADISMNTAPIMPEPEEPSVKKPKKIKANKKSEPIDEPEDESEPEEAADDSQPDDQFVFCKIKGDRMALMIPEGVEFKKQEVAGMMLSVVTVKTLDISSDKLQLLSIIRESKINVDEKKPTVVRVPIILNEKHQESASGVSSDDINELLKAKKDLDEKIKEARKSGDEELVNSLRKERRHVRAQINKDKQG